MLSQMDSKVKYRHKDDAMDTTDVFEITDFTTASDWERIIARLEDVIHEWKLPRYSPETKFPKDSFTTGRWKEVSTSIADVPDFEFHVKRYRLCVADEPDSISKDASATREKSPGLNDPKRHMLLKTSFSVGDFPAIFEQLLSTENDFPLSPALHPLAKWFGIADFLVLSPSAFNDIDSTVSEDRLKLLNSCISIAASNTRCPLPVFVQFDVQQRQMFFGVSEIGGFRTVYDIIDLEKIPDRLRNLSGLMEIFKEKIGIMDSSILVKASVQLTVTLRPDAVSADEEDEDMIKAKTPKLGELPFGSMEYDNFYIDLLATWPNANADALEDTTVHSDLDPLQAPKWAVQLFLNDKASQRLSDALRKFAKQTHHQETVQSLLEYLDSDANSQAQNVDTAKNALKRLTGPERTHLSTALYKRIPRYHLDVPIAEEPLNEILAYLFPDSGLAKDLENSNSAGSTADSEQVFGNLKSAPYNSFPYRLSLAVYYVLENLGGLLAVAYLWHEVLLELRYRWENSFLLTDIQPGYPNHGTCLLHQKLQMLNCCIEKRQQSRQANPKKQVTFSRKSPERLIIPANKSSVDSITTLDGEDLVTEDEDEEFYDCEEVFGEETMVEEKEKNISVKPEGRLHEHTSLKLLSDGVTPVFIPVTQEVAPMTEDAAAAHLERLAATDDDEVGRALRIKLQSAALVSDMSAFKAANPGCCFEDFVRWHSPRDWEEDPEHASAGHLSERMSHADSAWSTAWETAECKPVRRQKRLFDERVEAEKVLSFLNTTVGDVFRHLLPVFAEAVLIKLIKEMHEADLRLPVDQTMLTKSLSRILSDHIFNWVDFEKFIKNVASNEQSVHTYRSLLDTAKRSDDLPEKEQFHQFIKSLTNSRQLTPVPGASRSPLGQHILKTFDQRTPTLDSTEVSMQQLQNRKAVLPKVEVKEFLLRTIAPRPFSFNRPGVQRLYACMKKDSVRMAGAFSEDILYG
ncbi:rab3 GTPase-activating protein catalytic subunit-like [Paramacrobiotus metropolitanus]|uniref:rab3 GTPase-activating protein catalytic subunit-like n=1 Tax=Paramacrobiotus metropolitanus TaxID=2943436 RepID=UPI00244632E7|nr:rab3 GTPase-activating protein catalytic subunit-like [Paramacrobiotus metropolitanus]